MIGSEFEPSKLAHARANLQAGGLADLVEMDVVDPRRAPRAEQLHPLVVAVTRAPAVADQAKSAPRAPKDELRRVDVA